MDFKSLMKLLLPLIFLGNLIHCQLTNTDYNYIKKAILSSQDEAKGLFGKNADSTYKAIYSLKLLKEPIPHVNKICREITFEAMNEVTFELVLINDVLNCKQTFTLPSELRSEDMNVDLESLHTKVLLTQKANVNINWSLLYEILKPFLNKDKLFSNENGSGKSSLISTAYGLHLLTFIHANTQTNKEEAYKDIVNVFTSLQQEFQLLREDVGLFAEYNHSYLKVNSLLVEAIAEVHQVASIDNYEELLSKILNYFISFKYQYTDLDDIFYLLKGLESMNNIPIVQAEKKVFDYVEEKYLNLKVLNGFGRAIDGISVTVEYKLKQGEEIKTSKGDYDLDDESTVPESTGLTAKSDPANPSTVPLDLSSLIKSPGKYIISTKYTITIPSGNAYSLNYDFEVAALSKIKVNHLKMSVSNTQDKNDEKEITVEHPKRTFKNIKATQNSVVSVKVKLNFGDNQVSQIEQMFLRLRHNEIGKTYSAYVLGYKPGDDYYHINFDMSDSSQMEAYDGIYELTLIVSDVGLENPIIWNFGKLEVKFKKPLDPTNIVPSYKNQQKEKMEPSFTPEESPNKNIVSSLIFSSLILGVFFYYLIYLRSHKINMARFPKSTNTSKFLFAIGFVLLIFLITYIMILFFVKLNIIQTLIAFLALGLPGTIIIYKALSNINIEV